MTGGTIQTAASGARVVLGTGGIKVYDASNQRGELNNDGSGWFGNNSNFAWTTGGTLTINATAVNSLAASKVSGWAHGTDDTKMDGGDIYANTVTASQINGNTITATEIAAGTITTTQIASTTILAGNIAANTITTDQIAATTIVAGNIAANTITASEIAATTITGTQISSLSISGKSLTADTGTIGGWTLSSTSIYTGVEDHAGYTTNAGDLTIYSDGSNASIHAKNFYIDASGDLTCTSATITGALTAGAGSDVGAAYLTAGTITSKAITLAVSAGTGDAKIQAGKTDFGQATAGFILGIDDSVAGDPAKFEIGNGTSFLKWNGTSCTMAIDSANAFTIKSGGDIKIESGGDLILESATSGASSKIDFVGNSRTYSMAIDFDNDRWNFYTDTDANGSMTFGEDASEANKRFYNILFDVSNNIIFTVGAIITLTCPIIAASGYMTVAGGINCGGIADPGDDNLIVDGLAGIGMTPTRELDLTGSRGGFVVSFINNHATDGQGMRVRAGDSSSEAIALFEDKDGTERFVFYADGSTFGLCADIKKDLKIENPTPDDYLDWALEDAEKPHATKLELLAQTTEKNVRDFGKDYIKMSMGSTRWAKAARNKMTELEDRIVLLEAA